MLRKISKAIGMTYAEINEIYNNVNSHYEQVTIKRHHKEPRIVYVPDVLLNNIHHYIANKIIKTYKVSNHAKGYERGCSTLKALKDHRGSKHYLVIDIEKFYDNITYSHLYQLLKRQYSEYDIEVIWKLISVNNRLPLGTKVSPFLANRIMLIPDLLINKKCKKIVYTRYADDLIFSSKKYINSDFVEDVRNILRESDFKINNNKTRFMGPNQSQMVLGLIMNNKKITLGAKKRRALKSMVYNHLTKKELDQNVVQGHIAYAKMIEPDFIKVLAKKYNKIGYNRYF